MKLKIIGIMLVLCLMITNVFGEEKTNIFGINPYGKIINNGKLVFNMYSGYYGKIINNGKNEITIPFFYWHPITEISILSIGAKYRIYKEDDGKGLFYGSGIKFNRINWEYNRYYDLTSFKYKSENITGIFFVPEIEVGYRWIWDNGFTLAPNIGIGYSIGKIKSKDGIIPEYGKQGLEPSFGIGLGWMWK